MNVFEDLIEELKEENLIEETVIETSVNETRFNQIETVQPTPTHNFPSQTITESEVLPKPNLLFEPNSILKELNIFEDQPKVFASTVQETQTTSEDELKKLFAEAAQLEENSVGQSQITEKISAPATFAENLLNEEFSPTSVSVETEVQNTKEDEFIENDTQFPAALLVSQPVVNQNEFFRRRATEEVNSLQIVEHILSAIEREQMKIVPKPYDDIVVKMALHDFLKITESSQSNEHAQAEFKLMQETESWYSALAHRDKHISIGDLRRYCENTRPALSSQALVSLARFYRNSPFSETVRNKFDVVITRLLTKEIFPDKRETIFNRDELIIHLSGLYADWSSIPLYETDNDSDVLLATLKIEDFIGEANNAVAFEDLIKNDFFNRLRLFKESIGEKFFSPLLTATAIDCNVVVGNKYVDLVALEREKNNAKSLEDKYQFFLDQTVSDATSKTLQLVEVLKEKKAEVAPVIVPKPKAKAEQPVEQKETLKLEPSYKKPATKTKNPLLKINKWLLAALFFTVFGIGGLYLYVEVFTEQPKVSSSVIKVNLENSSLKEYFKTARINRGTFFAVIDTGWDKLSKDVKEDVLKKTLAVGSEQGYTKIHLTNAEGKTVAYASEKGIDLEPK